MDAPRKNISTKLEIFSEAIMQANHGAKQAQ